MEVRQYKYEALPPIPRYGPVLPFTRLLLLEPGLANEPFRGSLRVFNVNNAPLYEAVSYVWGDEPPSSSILLDGQQVLIRPSLEQALKHLRLPKQARRLWVDAVCIDQSNLQERSQQVQYMRDIYKQAARVIVWLGQRTSGVEEAIELASKVAEAPDPVMQKHPASKEDHNNQTGMEKLVEVLKNTPKAVIPRLFELLRRPYFQRCWCIQEIVACSWAIAKVEELEVPFADLARCVGLAYNIYGAARAIGSYEEVPLTEIMSPTAALWGYIHATKWGGQQTDRSNLVEGSIGSLLPLLIETKDFTVTDARDKVFALLGISNEGLNFLRGVTYPPPDMEAITALRVDYTKDLISVYRDLTRYQLHTVPGVLEVLSYVNHHSDPTSGGFPSWVPRWHEPRTCSALDQGLFQAGELNGMTGARVYSPISKIVRQPNTLALNGCCIDEVRKVSDVIPAATRIGSELKLQCQEIVQKTWLQLFPYPIAPRSYQSYYNGETLDVAFCMTMLAGPLGVQLDREAFHQASGTADAAELTSQARKDIASFLIELFKSNGAEFKTYALLFATAGGSGEAERFERARNTASYGRRVFLTGNGRMGLGPAAMRPGDEVVVFLGGRLAHILRRRADHHVYIGTCYVHDYELMSGRAVDRIRRTSTEQPAFYTFELR